MFAGFDVRRVRRIVGRKSKTSDDNKPNTIATCNRWCLLVEAETCTIPAIVVGTFVANSAWSCGTECICLQVPTKHEAPDFVRLFAWPVPTSVSESTNGFLRATHGLLLQWNLLLLLFGLPGYAIRICRAVAQGPTTLSNHGRRGGIRAVRPHKSVVHILRSMNVVIDSTRRIPRTMTMRRLRSVPFATLFACTQSQIPCSKV